MLSALPMCLWLLCSFKDPDKSKFVYFYFDYLPIFPILPLPCLQPLTIARSHCQVTSSISALSLVRKDTQPSVVLVAPS